MRSTSQPAGSNHTFVFGACALAHLLLLFNRSTHLFVFLGFLCFLCLAQQQGWFVSTTTAFLSFYVEGLPVFSALCVCVCVSVYVYACLSVSPLSPLSSLSLSVCACLCLSVLFTTVFFLFFVFLRGASFSVCCSILRCVLNPAFLPLLPLLPFLLSQTLAQTAAAIPTKRPQLATCSSYHKLKGLACCPSIAHAVWRTLEAHSH